MLGRQKSRPGRVVDTIVIGHTTGLTPMMGWPASRTRTQAQEGPFLNDEESPAGREGCTFRPLRHERMPPAFPESGGDRQASRDGHRIRPGPLSGSILSGQPEEGGRAVPLEAVVQGPTHAGRAEQARSTRPVAENSYS